MPRTCRVEGRTFRLKDYDTTTWPWFAFTWKIAGEDYVVPLTVTFWRGNAWDLAIKLYINCGWYRGKGKNRRLIASPWKGKKNFDHEKAIAFLKRAGGRVVMLNVKLARQEIG